MYAFYKNMQKKDKMKQAFIYIKNLKLEKHTHFI